MSVLARERCFQHPQREATARCMECQHSFCRECITEHGERLICAACLARLATRAETRPAAWRGALPALGALAGTGLLWSIFYALGRMLMNIPSSFHEETLWGKLFE